jgi:ribosomal protein S18 acetylase RimI-like enzyme
MTIATEIPVAIRPAHRSDLDAINAVVEAAVMSWALAEQVRPSAIPDCSYQAIDLDLSMLLLAVGSQRHILGVVACGSADPVDTTPDHHNALRLDGPYIHPAHDQQGIGSQLLDEARALARRQGRDGLLIQPRVPASGLLKTMDMNTPPAADGQPHSPHYWQSLV